MDRKPPTSRGPTPETSLELVVVTGDMIAVTRLPVGGAVSLGRAKDCDIRIDSRAVSRRHAILHLGPTLRIQDLGSANGTFVHDARLPVETAHTELLRKLSKESVDITIGERVNLGSIPIVVRRTAVSAPRAGVIRHDDGSVVRDPKMRELYEQAALAARSTISVLVLGETGVGKEVLARAIHDRSPRAARPYLEINCAALPPSLLEGELFGHEKNAFTGADHARAGLLESADGGTIFLDEIGELPPPVQVKLLRVLEDRKVLRLGGRTPRELDVRFVAATNRDLQAEIGRGNFREDLYYRLNGVELMIPPLRARVTEIAPLAERFLSEECQKLDRAEPLRLSAEALDYFMRYTWPGNVRELRNVTARAAVLCSGDVILPADLPACVTGANQVPAHAVRPRPEGRRAMEQAPAPANAAGETQRLRGELEAAERRRIVDALDQCSGNQTRAAKLLGISLRTLVNRLGKHDVPRPRKRD